MISTRTILLVEDDRDNREAMEQALRRQGYDVLTAGDAEEAEVHLNRGLPDLVISDMLLPGASGFSVIRSIEERYEGRVPVLMISANSSRAHREYAMAAGASRFLAKPFALPELVAAIDQLCPLPAQVELAALPV